MTTTNTTAKMTNKLALNYVLEHCDLPTDVREKVTKMLEQVEKKNSTDRKPTAKHTENEVLKSAILDNMSDNRLYTITEMIKEFPELNGLTNQRVSAIVRLMMNNDKTVIRVEDKRKAYFRKALEV